MRKQIRTWAIGLLAIIALHACTDDYFEFDKIKTDAWRPEFAVPAVSSRLTLEDIVIKKDSNNLIRTGQNGVLEIVYSGSVFAQIGGQFVDIPDQNFNQSVGLPASSLPPNTNPVPPGTSPVQYSETIDIQYNSSVEIDSILLKNGELVFTMQSSFQHNIDLVITFPGLRNSSGQPLVITETLPARTTSNPTVRSQTPDLKGYKLDMTLGSSSADIIEANIDMTVRFVGGNNISTNDRIDFIGQVKDLDFKEFAGYIGEKSLDLNTDTINIGMFRNFKTGTFVISNPTLEIDIKNSFGLPANLDFEKLIAVNPDQAAPKKDIVLPPDSITGMPNTRTLSYPVGRGLSVTPLRIDTSRGSNISEIISYLLKEIIYDSKVNFNPNGPSANRNFFSDTSGIGLDVALNLPFEGRAQNFFLIDTIPMDLGISTDLESGFIRTIADNGFPVEVTLQMVFTDSLYNRIDSLYLEGARPIIPAAPINANGDAIGTNREITDSGITKDRFNRLSDGRFAIIIAELNTEDAEFGRNVRFKPGYELGIDVSIRAKVLID